MKLKRIDDSSGIAPSLIQNVDDTGAEYGRDNRRQWSPGEPTLASYDL